MISRRDEYEADERSVAGRGWRWVVRSPDCRVDAERLGLTVDEHTDSSGEVRVRTVAIDEGLASGGVLPCFITYLVPTSPEFLDGPGISVLRVGDPTGALDVWLPDLPDRVHVVDGPPGIHEVVTGDDLVALYNRRNPQDSI